MRFTLHTDRWYACELIGDDFTIDKCSYSPIRVDDFKPLHTGRRHFRLRFYHANYPSGVNDKEYDLETLERGSTFILARSLTHAPRRILLIYDIDADWLERHFPGLAPAKKGVQEYLDTYPWAG